MFRRLSTLFLLDQQLKIQGESKPYRVSLARMEMRNFRWKGASLKGRRSKKSLHSVVLLVLIEILVSLSEQLIRYARRHDNSGVELLHPLMSVGEPFKRDERSRIAYDLSLLHERQRSAARTSAQAEDSSAVM